MEQRTPRSRLQKRSWRFARKLLLLSVLVGLVGLICIIIREALSVKEIFVSTSRPMSFVRGYEAFYSSFLPFVDKVELEKKLVSDNPTAAKVKVNKIYPNKLEVTIQTMEPAVSIKVAEEFALLASNGRVLQRVKTKPKKLPEISYYQELFVDQAKTGEILAFKDLQIAVKFIELLTSLGYRVNEVDIDSFYMIRLVLEDSREILVTADKDIAKQEYQIGAILRQFKVDGTSFKRLDVRFDKPVMTK